MAADLENFAYSFAHAIITLNEVQYLGIGGVSFNQDIEREAVYGTARSPLKQTIGQLSLGDGTITFSDVEDGMAFLEALQDNPSAKVFTVSVVLENAQGQTRSWELLGCALAGHGVDFEQGAGPLGLEVPITFLRLKLNGRELSTT